MRKSRVVIFALLAFFTSVPSLALEASDTMAAWRGASVKDKSEVVSRIIRETGGSSQPATIIRCLDRASGVPGHDDLLIAEVAEACKGDEGQPV